MSLPPVKLRAISRSFVSIRTMPRRFRPPWFVEELDACFVVRVHDGQGLAYDMVRLSDAGFVTFLLEA